MAYGEGMAKLNPCEDALICGLLRRHCPGAERLLDAGCGRGDRLAALQRTFPTMILFGIDRDGENLVSAKQNCPAAVLINGDFCSFPWQPESFDAILCECTLSLAEEPEAALNALCAALRPGGVLLLGDLSAEGDGAALPLCGEGVRRLFFRQGLEDAFDRAGLRILEYSDQKEALTGMAAQMIFDGSLCACLDAEGWNTLRKARAGYGLWALGKEKQ